MTSTPPTKNGVSSAVAPWVVAALGVAGFLWSQINQTASKPDLISVENRISVEVKDSEERVRELNGALDKRVNDINSTIATMLLTLAEYKEFKVRKDNDTVRQDEQIRMMFQTRLSRDEHIKDIAGIIERLNGERDAIAKVQDSIGGGGVGKQLDNLQMAQAKQAEATAAQIAELRRALDMRSIPPPKPP